jgi:hypothetical protein
MKEGITIYQSIWLKPFYNDNKDYQTLNTSSRYLGGWRNEKLFYLSWAYSLCRLKKYYPNVCLVSDELGKELFINKLGLHYDDVQCNLDELNIKNSSLWALGKLKTYSNANVPFLHFDGDVFIWDKIKPFTRNNELIFQNYEYNEEYYRLSLIEILDNFSFIPSFLENIVKKNKNIISLNAGVIGTNDSDFLKEYTDLAFEFVDKNKAHLSNINIGRFNTVYEQLLCFEIAKKRRIKLTPLLKVSKTDNTANMLKLVNFIEVPTKIKYIHPLGFWKKKKEIGFHLVARFENEFPDEYNRINSLL